MLTWTWRLREHVKKKGRRLSRGLLLPRRNCWAVRLRRPGNKLRREKKVQWKKVRLRLPPRHHHHHPNRWWPSAAALRRSAARRPARWPAGSPPAPARAAATTTVGVTKPRRRREVRRCPRRRYRYPLHRLTRPLADLRHHHRCQTVTRPMPLIRLPNASGHR